MCQVIKIFFKNTEIFFDRLSKYFQRHNCLAVSGDQGPAAALLHGHDHQVPHRQDQHHHHDQCQVLLRGHARVLAEVEGGAGGHRHGDILGPARLWRIHR